MEPEPRSRSHDETTQLLRSAVTLAADLTRLRDADTGMHLERVSRYARLIARSLAPTEGVDDEFIDDLSSPSPTF